MQAVRCAARNFGRKVIHWPIQERVMLNIQNVQAAPRQAGPRRLWVDLRELLPVSGRVDVLAYYQDHGIGLLRTILHKAGLFTDLISTGYSSLWFDVYRR